MTVKTRFAPSLTGPLHIGGIKIALYTWLFAKRNNGKFFLRIDNTDLTRYSAYSLKSILDSMNWLNLKWDGNLIYQSDRLNRYNDVIHSMLKNGQAYICKCSKDRLISLREKQIMNKKKSKYDGKCRDLNLFQSNNFKSYVVRFRNPLKGVVTFDDKIKGKIKFNNEELDDLIIRRNDGLPTYNLCTVIDDLDMKITHVVRGDDHINNTPRQINIIRALGFKEPQYAHVSMILDANGKKLSKRDNNIDIMQYKKNGYLPEAILNYLGRFCFSCDSKEIFSIEEMKTAFTFKKINKSPEVFDRKKLRWLNKHYINNLPSDIISKIFKKYINDYQSQNMGLNEYPTLSKFVIAFRKNSSSLKELFKLYKQFDTPLKKINLKLLKRYLNKQSSSIFTALRNELEFLVNWDNISIKKVIYRITQNLNINIKYISMPLRIAIINSEKSPSIDIILDMIGKRNSIRKINFILNNINCIT